ncbi:hypothetical protein AGLY_006875 [Aphis glycines]|uniref:Uncharacterized protein n=1 Tax=Aphis glycines TaxID=307491 RepID=A0A6G0TS72_APHGL|nr:hypothetical protein AGLY_006875 [Aphis glycines]
MNRIIYKKTGDIIYKESAFVEIKPMVDMGVVRFIIEQFFLNEGITIYNHRCLYRFLDQLVSWTTRIYLSGWVGPRAQEGGFTIHVAPLLHYQVLGRYLTNHNLTRSGILRNLNKSTSHPRSINLIKFNTDDFSVGVKTACPARWYSVFESKSVLQFIPKAHLPIVSIVNFDDISLTLTIPVFNKYDEA